MTHTLHRLGNIENLHHDYVVFAMSAKGINEEGSHVAMRRFMELAFDLDPVNAGDTMTGHILTHSRQEILDAIQDTSVVHAVFTEEGKVATLLKRVHEADLGISVVVSGLFDRVRRCAQQAGLRQHTVECSLGVWGQVERLPGVQVMQITTMCGHGMVAASLVEQWARDVRRGRVTPEEAALELAKPCVCGVFNPVRAARLLEAIAAREERSEPITAGQTTA
jgi:hypothetical protein